MNTSYNIFGAACSILNLTLQGGVRGGGGKVAILCKGSALVTTFKNSKVEIVLSRYDLILQDTANAISMFHR